MERASSSSASSSSSSASALFAGWFPSGMKEEVMNVVVRGISYRGSVELVEQAEPFWSTVQFKTPKPYSTRAFRIGDQAKLKSKNRGSWSGDVAAIEDDEAHLWTYLQIRVPSARDGKISLKSVSNVLVTVNPVGSLLGVSSKTEKGDSDGEYTRIRVGVNGFSKVGRILVQMGLQSIDVQVVAINDPTMTLDDMVNAWKSTNISIAKKDHQTLIFEKMYCEKDTGVNEGKKINVKVLSEQMEVTVFREQNQVRWEQVNVEFVVEYSAVLNNDKVQISDKNESLNNCLRKLPTVLGSFGLNVDERILIPHFYAGENSRRDSSFSIITRSTAATKAVCKVFTEWDEQPASLLFHANAVVDRSIDVDSSSVDLRVILEEGSGTNSIAGRFFCADEEEVKRRVMRIFSWCVDIVRCVPVGGCQLELI
ncbi:hypothetical protein PAHAL_5G454200 [Panicum hallii]|uniref:Glyceraldehyde 3-phosphate dehydrogenase NAD(P) binding domain-containing protein n=1 Tax=Panicum hallii TaxID=206008 RepID=A0A2S3HX98_9POAL|nr:glyceraldehyde-3-phosphate dehydrogenase 2, cytosolic-like isoform X2 [Panicum hallii]XP_025818015.1 glyceraldehyde-3-phosphate dehydrogenase 2, cytosolic-like isoform X2 [Panicum hallii]XP_025818054.1 glyceraldehyde-3-phosphate dehydrogenase 2, cytosolic-like isoform X2 [Panicum hallii]PAN31966.1 hypothetical protein PAHAL_5G453500 [Panicum hallii]PAN31969.1 hypothetical protein PAHAL_5G453500 [Panicum hallii]PAN31973.1 hypothetical protein PAHAL_5G454200 [Panicum hallii]PVH39206.1 hypoth